jgi:hypothetical protein
MGIYRDGSISVRRSLYNPSVPVMLRRMILAHEYAHALLGHSLWCERRSNQCEAAADRNSVKLLSLAYDIPYQEAVSLVYRKLMARMGEPAMGIHEDGCTEVAMFARAFGLPLPQTDKCRWPA